MINVTFDSENDKVHIHVNVTHPIIYLDQCVLRELSRNDARRQRFLEILSNNNGTLYFSALNLLEIVDLAQTHKYAKIKEFVRDVGDHFAFIDIDPSTVIKKEMGTLPFDIGPVFELDFTAEMLKGYKGDVPLSFAHSLEKYDDEEIAKKFREMKERLKARMTSYIADERRLYRTDSAKKAEYDLFDPSKVKSLTERIFDQLKHFIVTSNSDTFILNDAIDFFHAAVTVAYCDFVVLENKWARRLKNLGISGRHGAAQVYGFSEIDKFLDDLEKRNIPIGFRETI